MHFEVKKIQTMEYLIRYPDGYESNKKYPVILFLHGAGTRGTNIETLMENLFFKLTEKQEAFPFVCVAPLCNRDTWFDLFETLRDLVPVVYKAEYTDQKKLYLMGTSMGGYGTWALAMSLPEYFAAIVPICGGGMYWNAGRLVNIPVWAFHGGKDPVVYPEESKKIVDAINKAGGNAKLTIYPEAFHDAWTDTYSNPKVFEWLLSHENKNTAILKNEYADSKRFG